MQGLLEAGYVAGGLIVALGLQQVLVWRMGRRLRPGGAWHAELIGIVRDGSAEIEAAGEQAVERALATIEGRVPQLADAAAARLLEHLPRVADAVTQEMSAAISDHLGRVVLGHIGGRAKGQAQVDGRLAVAAMGDQHPLLGAMLDRMPRLRKELQRLPPDALDQAMQFIGARATPTTPTPTTDTAPLRHYTGDE